jgi:hypothetical protein
MAISIPSIIAVAALGGAVAEGVNALATSSKNSQPPALPATPSLDTAQSTAQGAQTQQRQAALAAGGSTNITNGTGIVLGSDVSSLTLVGSS